MIRTGVASKPTITREVTIHPTVCEVAQAFADMGADEQALCLHEIALVFLSWGAYARDHQILSIAKKVNPDGSAAGLVNELHNAIHPTLTPPTPLPGASPNKRNDDECTCAVDATSLCPIHHGYAR